VLLVFVVGEHLEEIVFAHFLKPTLTPSVYYGLLVTYQSLERLLFLHDLAHNVLKGSPIAGLNGGTAWQGHFVVKSIIHSLMQTMSESVLGMRRLGGLTGTNAELVETESQQVNLYETDTRAY